MKLFPVPQRVSLRKGLRSLTDCRWICLPAQAGFALKRRCIEMAHELEGFFVLPPQVTMGVPSSGKNLVRMVCNSALSSECYQLTVPSRGDVVLEASSDAGFFYGMQTLLQLLETPGAVPCLKIKDGPSLRERGYMLDVSRCKIPTMSTLKALIRSLSKLRYNSLQLYMEHTFAFAAHERVWGDYTPFTAQEIMEIDDFCREHFIELVPNINSFGHLERWLSLPEYSGLAECPQPCGVLHPSKRSLDFMRKLYEEFLPNFTSRKVNIGCDETLALGQGKSKAACASRGMVRVYLDFLTMLSQAVAEQGFKVEFWGDIIMHNPELIKELPPGITALEWGYEINHPYERDTMLFKKSGIDFLVCPGTSTWQSFLGRTTNMIGNIKNAIANGTRNGALGTLLTDWGDSGHHQYFPISWPGLSMCGASAWNAKAHKETVQLLPEGIARAFAPGPEGVRMAEFLLEVGRVYDDYSTRLNNGTAFAKAITIYDDLKRSKSNCFLSSVQVEEVEKGAAHIRQLHEHLIEHPFRGFDLENRELDNGLNMALAGSLILRRMLGGDWDRSSWLDLMRHIIDQHETLWLARNRKGGLHISSEKLRHAMDYDPDAWKSR